MSLALHQLGANVSHCFRWETDQSCNQLPHSLFPTTHMGAVEDFDIEQLAAIIQDIPNHERHIILFTGGPPCKDYSNIKQHQPGRAGSQGSLFDTALSIRDDIQNRWPHQSLTVLENVVPHPEVRDDFDQLSHSMGLRPVLIDAADGQIISRPRIWWASVDWESLPATLSRHTPWQLSLDTQLFPPVLFNPIAAELQPDCHIRDFDPPSVLTHGQLFHCLTTQASTDEGRPPPRSQQLPDDTWQRWQADHRQFAPWQYQPKYLVRKHGHDWQVATPEHREAMMGFPRGWTGPHNTDRTRNTMLGNSWHVPTAMWILFLLLLQPAFGIPPPTQRVRRGSLGTMVDLWLHNPRPWGPPPRASETLHMPQNDWQDHLTWAQHHATSLQQPQHCDPTILWAIAMQRTIPQLPQLQHNVLLDIADLRDDLTTDTLAWFEQLPPHCQRAYRQPKMITQVPLMTHLLHLLNYPQAQLLHEELSLGFDLLGPLRPGVNWHIRHDHKYLDPCDLDELRSFNKAYIQRKLQQHKIDDHWTLMATEIAGEVAQGRMAGPFEAPTHWTSRTVPLHLFPHTSRLLPIPHRDPIVAVAFSIQQTGSDGKPKVRRGEDWRRSGHNQTCSMHDQPYHHTPDHYIQCARQYHDDSHPLHVWGHDHDGAYRQLPLAQPEVAYVLLITPDDPTLWHHHVLLFGSAASVWGYNRFGDALTALARVLTLTPALHYVDDYGAIQPNHIATSSFSSFSKLNSLLGFHMKTSKEQPPAPSHKIQGVYIDLSATHATLRPCPDRVRTLSHTLSQCLEQGGMSNDTARRTAGKCNFVTGHLFGRVGRSALAALYHKAHSTSDRIDKPTRAAILCLLNILQHSSPRSVPLSTKPRDLSIIYTDAFCRQGETVWCVKDAGDQDCLPPDWSHDNGWAAVLFSPQAQRTRVVSGALPPNLLQQVSTGTNAIYFLEAWAALIAPVIFRPWITDTYLQLCDNEAAKHAIRRGVGKHQPLNCLLGAHWTWHNRQQLQLHIARVPTHANIADPFSRHDMSLASKHHWQILEPPMHALHKRTCKIIGDIEFAHAVGFDDIKELQQFHRNHSS